MIIGKSLGGACALSSLILLGCGEGLPEDAVSDDQDPEAQAARHHPAFLSKLRDPQGYSAQAALALLPESLCGASDLQHVNSYNGRLGQPAAFVKAHQRPVGAMESKGTDSSSKYCSGTLIKNDLFLTAGHCVDSATKGHYVSFNYERAAGSSTLLQQKHFRISAVVEDGTNKGVDYAVVRLEGNPGATFGTTAFSTADPATNSTLTIIQHPSGQPKQVEIGKAKALSGNYLSYGDIDTLPGSSGSGVLNAAGVVVAVHTLGGCGASSGSNSGVRLSKVRAVSQVIR